MAHTMAELAKAGKPFNPLSSFDGQGRPYSEKTAAKLAAAMEKHGWDDPRFLTEGQIEHLGLKPVPEAQKSMVLFRDSQESDWQRIVVYNGSQIEGLPSLGEMVAEANKKIGVGLTFDERVARGMPFNPLSAPDGQGREYSGSNASVLQTAMRKNGWKDPRFVTKAQIDRGGWAVAPEAVELSVAVKGDEGWDKVSVFHASGVVGMPSLEEMRVTAAAVLANNKALAEAQQAREEVLADGVVMNPLSGAHGHVYGGKNADKLLAAMAERGWVDGRFVTESQVKHTEGLSLVEGAEGVPVTFATANGFVNTTLFNAEQVVGMPTMAEQYAKIAGLRSPEHAAMALNGAPFDPLNADAEALAAEYDVLTAAMETHGWSDPRFISLSHSGSFQVKEGQSSNELDYYNASQLEDHRPLPNLAGWQALTEQKLTLELQRAKEQSVGITQAAAIPKAPALSVDMLDAVMQDGAACKLKLDREKVATMLGAGTPADGSYIGKVAAVDAVHGLVYQSQGRGKGEVLPMAALSTALTANDVGKNVSITVKDGVGTVAVPEAGQCKSKGR